MFSNFLEVLQGPSVGATDDSAGASKEGLEKADDQLSTEQAPDNPKVFDFWGVANALADSVKKTTADIQASVGDTDWKAELEAFGKGVRDDANQVQRHAHKAAMDGAQRLEALPQQAASARFPKVDHEKMKTQFDQVGSRIGKLGNRVLTSSKDLFEQVSEALQSELDSIEGHVRRPKGSKPGQSIRQAQVSGAKYSRLEADISDMQRSSSTYCDQPEDAEDFQAWLKGFDLESKAEDIEAITQDNTFMAELQSRIVPLIVQYDTFWTRYFYQLHKLKQKHLQMQSVVQRAASGPTEQVSWDEDDSDSNQTSNNSNSGGKGNKATPATVKQTPSASTSQTSKVKSSALPKGEEEPDTSTASDDSGNGPWTVVSSPTHKRNDSVEASSRPSPVPEEPAETPVKQSPSTVKEGHQGGTTPNGSRGSEGEEEEESDIDVSDAGNEKAEGGQNSDVEEDWGLWD